MFLEMCTVGLCMVFATLNHCGGDGGVIAEHEEEVGMGCVCLMKMSRDLKGPPPATLISHCLPPSGGDTEH